MSKHVTRSIDGILLLNKPTGKSSNFVLQKVKHLFQAKKAGHTGSLDPLATGMLPICFGQATKFSQYLLDADKCYEVTGVLGVKTDTSDATGQVIYQAESVDISIDRLNESLNCFRGEQTQIPSMFSALKHQGTPLYKLAREGKVVERKPRNIKIYHLELLEYDGVQFRLSVKCSKGTYIRNLVEDIGEHLGVGAHVSALHRVYTAGFEDPPMYSLPEVESIPFGQKEKILLPVERAIQHKPTIYLNGEEVLKLRQGQVIDRTLDIHHDDLIKLYDDKREFLGLGESISSAQVKASRLMAY